MTVLSETTQRIPTQAGYAFIVIGIIIVSVCFLSVIDNYIKLKSGIILVFVLGGIFFMVMGWISCKPHRKIKAILSEEYPAVSLYDKYDVKERDGEIWVLLEKEPINSKE